MVQPVVLEVPGGDVVPDRWIAAMVEHPILVQRPMLTADDGTTVVGRDPESLQRLLG